MHNTQAIEWMPFGEMAIRMQFGTSVSDVTQRQITQAMAQIDAQNIPYIQEMIPAYTTLTVLYDAIYLLTQGIKNPAQAVIETLTACVSVDTATSAATTKIIDIPVCYGGEYGPDLEEVASYHQLSVKEVIKRHSTPHYLIYMLGFAPGFPYLGGLDETIATPRKKSPRLKIEAGSVGIAGSQTGIYPIETPGGWQIIGRTPLALFQPEKMPPTLLEAGAMIRFVPISAADFEEMMA
ncbi:MAG: 5-oxoprolinase subunit PxpB [Candidatus Kurthia intestinigallinarum]